MLRKNDFIKLIRDDSNIGRCLPIYSVKRGAPNIFFQINLIIRTKTTKLLVSYLGIHPIQYVYPNVY